MEFRVKLSDQAENDFHKIPSFYDPVSLGLGEQVQDEILVSLEALKKDAFIYQKRFGEIRACFTTRFHFGIYYFVNKSQEMVYVVGIINTLENIQKIKKRTNKL